MIEFHVFLCVTYVCHVTSTSRYLESEVRPIRTSSGGWRNVTATAVGHVSTGNGHGTRDQSGGCAIKAGAIRRSFLLEQFDSNS